jgi:hypothetical protein
MARIFRGPQKIHNTWPAVGILRSAVNERRFAISNLPCAKSPSPAMALRMDRSYQAKGSAEEPRDARAGTGSGGAPSVARTHSATSTRLVAWRRSVTLKTR